MPPSPPIIIHHITDLHVGPLHEAASKKLAYVRDSGRPRNLQHYSEFLRRCSPKGRPDLVVVSGDLTSYATESEMNCAFDELRTIGQFVDEKFSHGDGAACPRVLVVPGNHDLDWTKESHAQKTERFSRQASALCQTGGFLAAGLAAPRGSGRQAVPWFDYGDEWNLFAFLFDSTTYGGTPNQSLQNIHQRFAEVYASLHGATRGPQLEEALDRLKREMVEDPGFVGQEQIDELDEVMKTIPRGRLKIAVMHHNPSAVPADDVEAFDAIVNAGLLKRALADHGFDLILHGHRHFPHCSFERTTARGAPRHGMLILGGDSLGCRGSAPFLEIALSNAQNVNRSRLPAASMRVRSAELEGGRYVFHREPFVEEPINRKLHGQLNDLLLTMGGDERTPGRVDQSIRVLDALLPALQDERSRLVDWGAEAEAWIQKFHYHLRQYRRIYATDITIRSSHQSPQYSHYLQRQYKARFVRIQQAATRTLYFSPPVYDAIMRTGWLPDLEMWGDFEIESTRADESDQLEIARILVRAGASAHEQRALERMDFEHRLFAIPLFVLKSTPELDQASDFVMGIDSAGAVMSWFEFDRRLGRVEQRDPELGRRAAVLFEKLLLNPNLVTVDRFLGFGVMVRDPEESRGLAEDYDRTRAPDPRVVELMRTELRPGPEKRGLDIGCGTGNYTLPFVNDFNEIVGLDVDGEMLRVAKAKPEATRITWTEAEALQSGLPSDTFDCVWSISTFHYFRGIRQKFLLSEAFRVLAPGGTMMIDHEFAEQILSLWLVEFFPSLDRRYRDACLPKSRYEEWLKEIGFEGIEFKTMVLGSASSDAALRIGQHEPAKYLDRRIRENIPAFRSMPIAEEQEGVVRLTRAIRDGSIGPLIGDYDRRATLPGDVAFIIARKPPRDAGSLRPTG